MATYDILSPVRKGGKRHVDGTIELDAKEGSRLEGLGVVARAARQAAPPPPPPPTAEPKPLADQDDAELRATAKAESIRLNPNVKDLGKIRTAIETGRARKAG